jgi:hypothetical protein
MLFLISDGLGTALEVKKEYAKGVAVL